MPDLLSLVHLLVDSLLLPVVAALAAFFALAIWESGVAVGERWGGLARVAAAGDAAALEALGRRRIERADMMARVGPMLGLMGTLIPLGPGIAALAGGDFATLARAVTTAFDTTVVGLVVGIAGFVLGRLRRRWYDGALTRLEAAHGAA